MRDGERGGEVVLLSILQRSDGRGETAVRAEDRAEAPQARNGDDEADRHRLSGSEGRKRRRGGRRAVRGLNRTDQTARPAGRAVRRQEAERNRGRRRTGRFLKFKHREVRVVDGLRADVRHRRRNDVVIRVRRRTGRRVDRLRNDREADGAIDRNRGILVHGVALSADGQRRRAAGFGVIRNDRIGNGLSSRAAGRHHVDNPGRDSGHAPRTTGGGGQRHAAVSARRREVGRGSRQAVAARTGREALFASLNGPEGVGPLGDEVVGHTGGQSGNVGADGGWRRSRYRAWRRGHRIRVRTTGGGSVAEKNRGAVAVGVDRAVERGAGGRHVRGGVGRHRRLAAGNRNVERTVPRAASKRNRHGKTDRSGSARRVGDALGIGGRGDRPVGDAPAIGGTDPRVGH